MRLATWNILNGTALSDGRVDVDRLRAVVGGLDADVLALQEVDRHQPRSHGLDLVAEIAADAAAARFEPALWGTPGFDWRLTGQTGEPAYGVGLISRWPVRSWEVLRMSPAPVRAPIRLPGAPKLLWLRDEPRVALAAVLETPAGPLTVAATHLSFVPGWNVAQLRRVTRWLTGLPGPHVLLGDLNMPSLPARLTSGWTSLGRTATYPSSRPRIQLDHVLGHGALPAVRAVSTPSVPVSDHRPLVVDLHG